MKKYLALLLALCMIVALAACGQSAAPAQVEAAPAEADAEPTEEEVDYSGYTIRIYSNSNSTERTTWLIQEAK